VRNDSPKCLILGYLDGQALACAVGERAPRPQNDAVRVGITRGDPLRIQITPLMPSDTRTAGRSDPSERSAHCHCSFEEGAAADLHHLTPRRVQARRLAFGTTTVGVLIPRSYAAARWNTVDTQAISSDQRSSESRPSEASIAGKPVTTFPERTQARWLGAN